jgi:hypothetical protein
MQIRFRCGLDSRIYGKYNKEMKDKNNNSDKHCLFDLFTYMMVWHVD